MSSKSSHSPPAPVATAPITSVASIALRYGIFTVGVFWLIFGIWELASSSGMSLFQEGSPLEWLQLALVLSAAAVFLIARPFRQLSRLLAILAGAAGMRELDAHFDRLLPIGGWQLPFSLLIFLGLFLAWKARAVLSQQIR